MGPPPATAAPRRWQGAASPQDHASTPPVTLADVKIRPRLLIGSLLVAVLAIAVVLFITLNPASLTRNRSPTRITPANIIG